MQLYAVSVTATRQFSPTQVGSTTRFMSALSNSMEVAIEDGITAFVKLGLKPQDGYHSHQGTAIAISAQLVTKAYESLQGAN